MKTTEKAGVPEGFQHPGRGSGRTRLMATAEPYAIVLPLLKAALHP